MVIFSIILTGKKEKKMTIKEKSHDFATSHAPALATLAYALCIVGAFFYSYFVNNGFTIWGWIAAIFILVFGFGCAIFSLDDQMYGKTRLKLLVLSTAFIFFPPGIKIAALYFSRLDHWWIKHGLIIGSLLYFVILVLREYLATYKDHDLNSSGS